MVQFGKPTRILGATRPASNYRIPFVENIVWIDKRVQSVDMERQQVLSTDQRRLEVDAFARYRIVDPLLMSIRAREDRPAAGSARADPRLRDSQRAWQAPFAALASPERQGVMENVRRSLERVAAQYGARIIDVHIKKADLPDGTPLQSAFDRMRSASEQEARSIRAEGASGPRSSVPKPTRKRHAFMRTALGKTGLLRVLSSDAVVPDHVPGRRQQPGCRHEHHLSPQNDYLKEFTGRGR